jgi:ABC-type nitrate/sulfonate/bicarbonate transport system substrate-binding protein
LILDRLRLGPACYHVLHILPPQVAHEMNYFVDEGLVDRNGRPCYDLLAGGMVPYGSEKTALAQAMKEKGVHITMDIKPSTVWYLNRRGAKLRIIAGWRNQHGSWIMGKPGINAMADVRGKLVGLKDYGSNRYDSLAYQLTEAGVDPEKEVRYVRGVSHGETDLREGRIDVGFVSRDVAPDMLAEGFTKLLDLTSLWPEGRPNRVVVATDEVLNERPEWVIAFVKAMIRAYWFMRTMPDNYEYLANMERRMRLNSYDPEEHSIPLSCDSPGACEVAPFPIDGLATGFDAYMQEWLELGQLDTEDTSLLQESLRLDFAREGFAELQSRPDLKDDLARAREVAGRIGY